MSTEKKYDFSPTNNQPNNSSWLDVKNMKNWMETTRYKINCVLALMDIEGHVVLLANDHAWLLLLWSELPLVYKSTFKQTNKNIWYHHKKYTYKYKKRRK